MPFQHSSRQVVGIWNLPQTFYRAYIEVGMKQSPVEEK